MTYPCYNNIKQDNGDFVGYTGSWDGDLVTGQAGSVAVFSSLTLHRSGPNISQFPRRAINVQFCFRTALQ
eukprot:UN14354